MKTYIFSATSLYPEFSVKELEFNKLRAEKKKIGRIAAWRTYLYLARPWKAYREIVFNQWGRGKQPAQSKSLLSLAGYGKRDDGPR